MDVKRLFKIITQIQRKDTTYEEIILSSFGELPHPSGDFLASTSQGIIESELFSPSYGEKLDIRENKDKATIGLFLFDIFSFHLYKNVYLKLPESEFIVYPRWIQTKMPNWYLYLDRLFTYLNGKGVRYRVLPHSPSREFFERYDTLVSNLELPNSLMGVLNGEKKLVRMMYGHAKDLYNFGMWSRFFDLVLTYGPYSDKAIKLFAPTKTVGNPRFDVFFAENDTKTEATLEKTAPKRKTILYAPTHGNLSSLDKVAEELPRLCHEYDVIVKPHHMTLHFENDRMQNLRRILGSASPKRFTLVDDFTDIVEVLGKADIVISDNSGAIFDAVLADKPILILNLESDSFFKEEMWNVEKISDKLWTIPLTYKKSIEQRIKNEPALRPGEVVNNAKSIKKGIASLLASESLYKQRRKDLRKMLFSHLDGSSAKSATDAIRGAHLCEEKTYLALMSEAEILKEVQFFKNRYESTNDVLKQYINTMVLYEGKHSLEPVAWSVVIPTYNRGAGLAATLEALGKQEGVLFSEFEIVIIDDGSQNDNTRFIQGFIERNPLLKIAYLKLNKNYGPSVARNIGILKARGEFICFTDDDCVVPKDWIASFKDDFKTNPEIGGSGGWYRPALKQQNFLAYYGYWIRMPHILVTFKSSAWSERNQCGNTANVCYRKFALQAVGGFNPYFRFASTEDWELKIRMHKARYALLSNGRNVVHQKKYTLKKFIRDYLLRGWSNLLLVKLHPDFTQYRPYCFSIFFTTLFDLRRIFAKPVHEEHLTFSKKILFAWFLIIRNSCLVFGKYWSALKVRRLPPF